MLEYQEQLARKHKYKPIPRTFFCDVRAEFQKALPEWCNISGDTTPLENHRWHYHCERIQPYRDW